MNHVRQKFGDVDPMLSNSPGISRRLISLAIVGVLATASCGTNEQDTSPRPILGSSSDSDESDQRERLYEYCETAPAEDPLCHTSRFGNDRRAADEFLEGADVGPGGLKEMTATDDGFPAGTPVGSSLPRVNATWAVNISEEIESEGTCEVLMDHNAQLGAVTDPGGSVQAFIILNPVVETPDGIRIGASLADLQARYSVDVQEYGTGKIAYTVRDDVVSDFDDTVEPSRAMLFYLSADDAVEMWVVGATSYVEGTASEGLCPVA